MTTQDARGRIVCEGLHLTRSDFHLWFGPCEQHAPTDREVAFWELTGGCVHEHVSTMPLCTSCLDCTKDADTWYCRECHNVETQESVLEGHESVGSHQCKIVFRQEIRLHPLGVST